MGVTLPPNAIAPGPTRTLLALVAVYDEFGRATIQEVADRTGQSTSTAHAHLRLLAGQGLVAGLGVRRGGALRPTLAVGSV